MTDAELLEIVLRCVQIRRTLQKPTDDESETDKYLRWAVEGIAKRIWWDNREK